MNEENDTLIGWLHIDQSNHCISRNEGEEGR